MSHVSVYVLNQDSAYDFYVNKLGFKVNTDAEMGPKGRWLTVNPPEQLDLEITLMAIDDKRRAAIVKFEEAQARRNAAKEGVTDKASFVKADLFESDFSQAQVITMFLLSSINMKLRPKILELRPGTRIVSNTFDMGDWKPLKVERVKSKSNWDHDLYLWHVEAGRK